MAVLDFTVKEKTGQDTIRFGNAEKTVEIDVTFIPAVTGYELKHIMSEGDGPNDFPPEKLARMIALFTTDADAQWIVENTDYGTLDKIGVIIINKAFGRLPEKN